MKDIYFDIETLDFFQDDHIKTLPRSQQVQAIRFGIACTWSEQDGWRVFDAAGVGLLWDYLMQPNTQTVGWNILEFDWPIVAKSAGHKPPLAACDIFSQIRRDTGRWCSLESVAQANLGRGKSANGQQAKVWLTSNNPTDHQQAIAYCQQDVQLVIDLHAMLRAGKQLLLPANPKRSELEMRWSVRS